MSSKVYVQIKKTSSWGFSNWYSIDWSWRCTCCRRVSVSSKNKGFNGQPVSIGFDNKTDLEDYLKKHPVPHCHKAKFL